LSHHRGLDGITGTRKGPKKGFPLGIDLLAVRVFKRCTQNLPARGQDVGIALPHLLEEARRPIDIGEE
jgi:hypothetical protein